MENIVALQRFVRVLNGIANQMIQNELFSLKENFFLYINLIVEGNKIKLNIFDT